MNVVDSSAWLEYFADSPNAGEFAEPIADTEHLIVPSITLLESSSAAAFSGIPRRHGTSWLR